ncbi:MAG: sulfatase [Planctomycetota bacterium]|nr:MAG: sulfatase [Planctomycetota bacterium]
MSERKIDRRLFLKIMASELGLAVTSTCAAPIPESKTEPNIVFILADDMSWHQLGCYGSRFYQTPNIDRLAKQGMRFTNAYAAAPVSSPTRASILTGRYPARLHLTSFIPGVNTTNKKLLTPQWTRHLPLEETTLAELLKSQGYATGHFGKWHLNKDKKYQLGRPGDPRSQGFDDVLTTHKPGASPQSTYQNDWHHVRQITERALAFIQNNKDKPFFCYIPHNTIHSPEKETEQLIAKYAAKPNARSNGTYNPVQAAMIETLDNSVGTILQKLGELNLQKNTIVVFFSDNGHLGPKNGLPFRGSKGDLYEGGIRMPLIIRWPQVVRPASICEEVVISNDFFPTFAELAAVTRMPAHLDGISLAPLLKNHKAGLNRDALYWHFPHYHGQGLAPSGAIRRGKYKLIEWFEKSIYGEKGALELYDLDNDPAERNNLAASMPDLAADLYRRLRTWRKQIGAQLMTPNPDCHLNTQTKDKQQQ